MKWLIRIAVIVVLLVVVVGIAGAIMIDSIATTAVAKGAAFATQTDVEVQKVDVKLFSNAGEITGLDIKNPDGPFREMFDSFLVLGSGKAAISAGSVISDLVEIPTVELSDIELSLVSKDGKKNYEVILASLKRFQGDAPPKETEGGKQFVIKKTTISRITVNYDFDKDPALGALPAKGTIEIAFDKPMVLENLGQGGVPMSQITADLITDILVQVTANMATQLGDQFAGHIKGLSGSLVDTLGENKFTQTLGELDLGEGAAVLKGFGVDLGEGATDLIKGIGGGAGDLGEKATDTIKKGLGGLLGGDEEKKE